MTNRAFAVILAAVAWVWFAGAALAQTQAVLPNGMTQFVDGNGAPYAGGRVFMYVPGTTTPKVTYQDPNGKTPNQNPVTLDTNGRAILWGSGEYRQVLQDVYGNVVWDQLTLTNAATAQAATVPLWYGTAIGTANAITLTGPTGFVGTDGQEVGFVANATNTGSVTINASGYGSLLVEKNTSTGPAVLTGNEIVIGNLEYATYSASLNAFLLQIPAPLTQQIPSGQISMFGGSACPTGWVANDGSAVSRTSDANLYAVIGTTYGTGDGSTTFNLPNDLGRFWRSVNTSGSGPDSGRTLGSNQAQAVASTTGPITATSTLSGAQTANTVYTYVASGGSAGNTTGSNITVTASPVTGTVTTTGTATVGTGSDTRPVNIAYLSCIKL